MRNTGNSERRSGLRGMTVRDLALWGAEDVAYVKQVPGEGGDGTAWAIHAADGTQMGLAGNRELAFAAVRQHDLEPLSVH